MLHLGRGIAGIPIFFLFARIIELSVGQYCRIILITAAFLRLECGKLKKLNKVIYYTHDHVCVLIEIVTRYLCRCFVAALKHNRNNARPFRLGKTSDVLRSCCGLLFLRKIYL